jgi:hypothetical protein
MRKCKIFATYSGNPQKIKEAFLTGRRYTSHFRSGLQYSTATVGLYCTQRKLVPLSHIHITFPSQHPPSIHQLIPMMSHLMLIWGLSLTTSLCLGLFLPFVVCFFNRSFSQFLLLSSYMASTINPFLGSSVFVFLTVPWIRVWPR